MYPECIRKQMQLFSNVSSRQQTMFLAPRVLAEL